MNISGVNFTGGFIVSPAVDNQFNYVTALLHGDGASAGTNNTFLDSSTNNFAITRTGNVTQGSFGPYGTLWSNYNPSATANNSFTVANNAALQFGTGDFTVEFWAFVTGQHPSDFYTGLASFGGVYGTANTGLEFTMEPNGGVCVTSYTNTTLNFYVSLIAQSSGLLFNTWHHFAISRSGTTIYAFTDGVLKGTVTGNSTNLNGTGIGAVVFKRLDSTTSSTPGYISNLRALKGTALYTAAFTPPTAPLTAITNTSLLTCQSNRFKDNSTNNFTLTLAGSLSTQRYSPFGTTTQYDPAVIGGSAVFGTTTDYLTVPSSSNFAFGTGDFTVEAWLYPTAAPNASGTFFIVGSTTNGFIFGYQNATTWGAASNGGAWFITSTTLPTLNAWNYIAITRSSGTAYLFLNGTLLTSAASSQNFPAMSTFIGHPSSNLSVNGNLSNLRALQGTALYTTSNTPPTTPLAAITNTALLLNFTNGQIYDNGMMNNFITVGSAQVSTSVVKYGTGSIFINGSGNYLTMPSTVTLGFGTSDFTIEGWLYLVSTSSYSTIISNRTSDTDSTAGRWSVAVRTSAFEFFSGGSQIVSSGTVSTSTWTHFAVSRSSGSLRLFLNGTQVGSTTSFTTSLSTLAASIGANGAGTEPLTGYIDELRITNGFARYTANFTAPTSQFPSTGPIPIPPIIEYLVVAGGGGGGTQSGGGGGAGGASAASGLSLTLGTTYTVTVGSGGAGTPSGGNGDRPAGTSGLNSVFGSITSLGGGGGGSYRGGGSGLAGVAGGSGGGGGVGSSAGAAGGTGTSGQGFAGGTGGSDTNNNLDVGGGGGGGGAAGVSYNDANTAIRGNGGIGVLSSISGTATYYAGGGGGATYAGSRAGSGGLGGGGAGGNSTGPVAASNGTANSGGGGGAGWEFSNAGGTGGSGIVIIRFASGFALPSSTTGSPSVTTTGGYNTYTWTSSGSITF